MSNDKKGQQGDPKKSADNLKKKILGSIQGPYTGDQTQRWILNMNDEQLLANQLNVASESNNLLDLNVVKLIDSLFDDFQRYVFEYQRTPAGSGFILNCHRPTADDPPMRPEYGQVPILCQGHVSTSSWAMIVQGQVGKVHAFIVPVEFLVGFKATQGQFSPFVEAKAVAENGKNEWRIDEHSISQEMLPIISKRIFGALIKVQRGEANNTDKFVFDLSEPDEEEYIEPVENRYKPQLLSDANGPSQQRTTAQQQQYQQPEFGRPAGAPQPVPGNEHRPSQAGPPQTIAYQQPPGQTQGSAYQGPPAFQRSQIGSQQQAPVYQQPQAGPQQQAPAFQRSQTASQPQAPAYQQPQAGSQQQAPVYQQPQAGSQQQAPVYQQPQASSQQQQAPVYQQPQASSQQRQAPVYQQPQAGSQQQQAPVYQQPQAGSQQQQAPVYQQPQTGSQQQAPAYQQPQVLQQTPYQQPQGGPQQQSPAYPAQQQIPAKGFSQQNPQQQGASQQQNAQQRPPAPNTQPPQQVAQPNPAYQSPAAASMNQVFDRNRLIVGASLDELVAKLDIELESLARIGMKAIQSQDMAAAQFTINRATKLKDVRQRVNDLSNEWKSSVS